RDVFIHLVRHFVAYTQFGNGADILDVSGVGCAPARRKPRRAAGFFLNGCEDEVGQPAWFGVERLAGDAHVDAQLHAANPAAEELADARHQIVALVIRVKPDVELRRGRGRDHIVRRIADVDRRDLQIGWLEAGTSVVQLHGAQLDDRVEQGGQRIGRLFRIGDVTLAADGADDAVEAAAPSV